MKLTFLGTSAANAYPEAFCKCGNCEKARLKGGHSLRKRSSLLINDDLLVDLGPDIMVASQMHACSLTNIHYCIQTHPHSDHLDLSHLISRSPELGVVGAPCMHFFASSLTLQSASRTFERDLADSDLLLHETQLFLNIKLHTVEPNQTFGFGNYHVTGFRANHALETGALLYAIEFRGKSVFYGTDTAPLLEETWKAFHDHSLQFNAIILDHTYGAHQSGDDHLNAREVHEHIIRMNNEGLLVHPYQAFATHIAHEGNPSHEELVEIGRSQGYEIAYDGLEVVI